MATIADNLNTLQVIKVDIKNAINSKGGTANDDFRTYANAIEELPSGGGDDTLGKLMKNELTTYNIPNGVTEITLYKFSGCTSLTEVIIPDSVTNIGIYVFRDCSSLTSVTIGSGLTSIGSHAFSNCTSLTDIIYNGAKAQFSSITKGTNWRYNVQTSCIVHCTDGDYPINNF